MFPKRFFCGVFFTQRYWPQSEGNPPPAFTTPPDEGGLEFTIRDNRLHYTIPNEDT